MWSIEKKMYQTYDDRFDNEPDKNLINNENVDKKIYG